LAQAVEEMRAQGRHAEAQRRYEELVAWHQQRAGRIACRYLGDGPDADEAVQDAFVKAYVNWSSFRRELPFEVWFTRILTNQCLDRLRARKRRDRWLVCVPAFWHGQRDYLETVASAAASPEDHVLSRERRLKLANALRRLPRAERVLIMRSHGEGLTSLEVSALTGIHPSTIRVRLCRAIRKLRALLADG
jgi:RNA polymerase sigma-70 factor (ECF subfamily)